jgi:type I restriction enzyme R subunit
MMNIISESDIEKITLEWLDSLEYNILNGPSIAPGESNAERDDYYIPILPSRLRHALISINPKISANAIEDVIHKIIITDSPSLIQNSRNFHRMLVKGVTVEYPRPDGTTAGDTVRLIDFEKPDNNNWLAVNQFTIKEGQQTRRFDIVIFVNGLPIIAIELKNPTDEKATVRKAFDQFQTYKDELTSFFPFNEMLMISDGTYARVGTISAPYEWFMRWRTITGNGIEPTSRPELEVLIKGICDKRRLLDMIRHYIVYEEDPDGNVIKKMAGYHQFHAVREAITRTIEASGVKGSRKCGVVWHTQGSGKSLTMVFYAGQVILHPEMENPTILVITDRNDLDDQLFGTFTRCKELLGQNPEQAVDRDDLKRKLAVASGGVVFTTIQKFLPEKDKLFYPLLSDRRNIVVIADEAHRSQYGFEEKFNQKTGKKSFGFAKYLHDALPNASFIGFTGTPIELADKNTRTVFGDYIDVYDVQRAIDDGATVPIYYEARYPKIQLDKNEQPHIDPEFEEVTETEEEYVREGLKTKWAQLEKIVGSEKRIDLIAEDFIKHFETREAERDVKGKAMIVCMSRRICVELYNAITRIRPEWQNDADDKGLLKVIMTGAASDNPEWQQHIRSKHRRETLAKRFKNAKEDFKIAIVRDMWLTGFDVPSLHTMYVDKPMRGHTLMQAIARVNRVYPEKDGGLIVDYLGLAEELRQAVHDYTANKGEGKPILDINEAVKKMLYKHAVCKDLFHGFDWSGWLTATRQHQLAMLRPAVDHILSIEKGKERFYDASTGLIQAFGLAIPDPRALAIREDVSFFKTTRALLIKHEPDHERGKSKDTTDLAIRQIVSKAISTDQVIDIFEAAGLKKPDISILDDKFLGDIRNIPHKNLAIEALRRLLKDEIKNRSKKNLIQSKRFSELLENTIKKYQNRSIGSAIVIEHLIDLAKEMREAYKRGDDLGLSESELAFYDALEVNDSAVKILGDETLKKIAQDLVKTVKQNVSIDWTVRESVRAKMRIMIKRILRKYGYPPDKQEAATNTVLQQAEQICKDLTSS